MLVYAVYIHANYYIVCMSFYIVYTAVQLCCHWYMYRNYEVMGTFLFKIIAL